MWPLIYLLKCLEFFPPPFIKSGSLHLMSSQRCMDSWSLLSTCTALYLCATFHISKDVINVHHGSLTPCSFLGKVLICGLPQSGLQSQDGYQHWPSLFICHQDGYCSHKVCLHSTSKQFHLFQQQTFGFHNKFCLEELLVWWN